MIQLSTHDGEPVWIDPVPIQVVREFNGGTRLTLEGGAIFQVAESVDFVLEARRLALARSGAMVRNLTVFNAPETKEEG